MVDGEFVDCWFCLLWVRGGRREKGGRIKEVGGGSKIGKVE